MCNKIVQQVNELILTIDFKQRNYLYQIFIRVDLFWMLYVLRKNKIN